MSFFCTFLRDPGTTWVILGAFSVLLPEKSLFALFRVTQARPRLTQARPRVTQARPRPS
ncbi:hypothetical protein T11_6900 [Trichinella zimbabwensis]|uniref:Uncharacterized protein n=1 Tax=Trichinella zimbabwensis TaxID=268475 RepID=A0A0V1G8J3_9BILA|nr:hypothetical protein T11_6900 [Trichinella zimbabwensis]